MLAGDRADGRVKRDSLSHDVADRAVGHGWWAPSDCVK